MSCNKITKYIGLTCPIVIFLLSAFDLIPTVAGFQLDDSNKILVIGFSIVAFLLTLYSTPYINITESIGTSLYLCSTTLILLSNNLFVMVCAWEIAASSSILILASNCKTLSSVLRYASIHFIGGALILSAAPYHLMITDITSIAKSLDKSQMIMLITGILINCASFPLSTWVTESYPAASPHGTAILQTFTTKAALFMLFKIFNGYKVLIIIGFITAIYSFIYSLKEQKLRTILAYNTVGQMGLMISSIGFSCNITPYIFSSMVYQTLMYCIASAIIYSTGREHLQELGGLLKRVPILTITALIGLCTMSSLPLTINFNTKHIIIESIHSPLLLGLFLTLNLGLVLSCGIRLVYFVFFYKAKYTGTIIKTKATSNTAIICSAILCIIPITQVKSGYEIAAILEQISLFVIACLVFHTFKSYFYNAKYRLLHIDDIYKYMLRRSYCLELIITKIFIKLNSSLNKNIQNTLQKLDNLIAEPISYTILCVIITIGTLIGLYV